MKEFVKAMVSIETKLKSGNSVPVERTTITAEEFRAISNELERLQSACHKLQIEPKDMKDIKNWV